MIFFSPVSFFPIYITKISDQFIIKRHLNRIVESRNFSNEEIKNTKKQDAIHKRCTSDSEKKKLELQLIKRYIMKNQMIEKFNCRCFLIFNFSPQNVLNLLCHPVTEVSHISLGKSRRLFKLMTGIQLFIELFNGDCACPNFVIYLRHFIFVMKSRLLFPSL